MSFREKMFELSRRLMTETEGQAAVCSPPYIKPDQRSRRYSSPLVSFVTIVKPTGHADADVPFPITIPARQIVVVSTRLANIGDTLALHFVPLNLQNRWGVGTALAIQGDENWLPLCKFGTAQSKIGLGWIFDEPLPVQTMYLDIGQESGGAAGVPITFALSENIVNWHLQATTGN